MTLDTVAIARPGLTKLEYLAMDLDAEIREKILARMQEKGITQADICRCSGVHKGTLSSYLVGRTHSMSWDKYSAIEACLGGGILPPKNSLPPSSGQALTNGLHLHGVRRIPSFDIRLWPKKKSLEHAMQEIRSFAAESTFSTHPDPQLFAVRVASPIGSRILPGDELLISPSTPPLHGQLVAVETELGLEIGDYISIDGSPRVRIGASKYLKDFNLKGTVIKVQWDPMGRK